MPKRRAPDADALVAAAKASGYKVGQHQEADQLSNQTKYCDKTKLQQDYVLRKYVVFQTFRLAEHGCVVGEETVRAEHLGPETQLPELAIIKDYFRFYAACSQGSIKQKVTADSLVSQAERFFAGFKTATQLEFPASFRSKVYHLTSRVDSRDLGSGTSGEQCPQAKYNFSPDILKRIDVAIWSLDDGTFIADRYRLQFFFILHAFCWTGARIGAFFKGGIKYKDLTFVLEKTEAGWRPIYKLDQRWVKNNKDPENVAFGTALYGHERLITDDTLPLLAIAMADDVFADVHSLEDLREISLPSERRYFELEYKKGAEDRFFLRKVAPSGAVEKGHMPVHAFGRIFAAIMSNLGYRVGVSVHSIRRYLGKMVDKRYTAVQRSQHITQADERVFGQSYVANTSSVDGMRAFFNEPADHRAVDYFQSLERFHEDGLPLILPNERKRNIDLHPEILELSVEIAALERSNLDLDTDQQRLAQRKQDLKKRRLSIHKKELERWRDDYAKLSKAACVRPNEVNLPLQPPRHEIAQILCEVVKERGRIRDLLLIDRAAKPEEWWEALHNMHAICMLSPTLYLPGHIPLKDRCPATSCNARMDGLQLNKRNAHIHDCVRRELSDKGMLPRSQVRYCYLCFKWCSGNTDWARHCNKHLGSSLPVRCGSLTYRHTLVRSAYCPFCLGERTLPAEKRLQGWSRDRSLWGHILEEHMDNTSFPRPCPHPRCHSDERCWLANVESAVDHLIDYHSLTSDDKILSSLESNGDTPAHDDPVDLGKPSPGSYPVLMPFGKKSIMPISPVSVAAAASVSVSSPMISPLATPMETVCPTWLTLSSPSQTQPADTLSSFEDEIIDWGDDNEDVDQHVSDVSTAKFDCLSTTDNHFRERRLHKVSKQMAPEVELECPKKVTIRLTHKADKATRESKRLVQKPNASRGSNCPGKEPKAARGRKRQIKDLTEAPDARIILRFNRKRQKFGGP